MKSEFSSANPLANHLTFPCLKVPINGMGMGAFSCTPGTLGDRKLQGVKNHALPEWLLFLWAEDSNRLHRKHKLKPYPAAVVLPLKIGTLPSVINLLALVYLISDGSSGFGMSSWLAPVKLSYHDLPLSVLEGHVCHWKKNYFEGFENVIDTILTFLFCKSKHQLLLN